MNNKLTALNNYIFETLERMTDDSLSDEEMQREITRSQAVTSVAETIIHNGELSLKALKHAEEYNIGNAGKDRKLPPMLEAKD